MQVLKITNLKVIIKAETLKAKLNKSCKLDWRWQGLFLEKARVILPEEKAGMIGGFNTNLIYYM